MALAELDELRWSRREACDAGGAARRIFVTCTNLSRRRGGERRGEYRRRGGERLRERRTERGGDLLLAGLAGPSTLMGDRERSGRCPVISMRSGCICKREKSPPLATATILRDRQHK